MVKFAFVEEVEFVLQDDVDNGFVFAPVRLLNPEIS